MLLLCHHVSPKGQQSPFTSIKVLVQQAPGSILSVITVVCTVMFLLAVARTSSCLCSAGKTTTDEELDEMLEGGNSAVFTAGVSLHACMCMCMCMCTQTPAANQRLWPEARTLSGLWSTEAVITRNYCHSPGLCSMVSL